MLIDYHTHLTIFQDGYQGNILKAGFFKRQFVNFIKLKFGISLKDKNPEETYIKNFSNMVRESKFVDKACVMALDGVYDSSGELDKNKTTFLISNDYLFDSLKPHSDVLLPIASINPQRKDALDELDRVAELGTVAIKFLPNSQGFDPSNKKYIPFYKKLADKKIPIICHAGFEFALYTLDQSLGHPKLLRTALEQGVNCISAHGGGTGMFVIELYGDILRELAKDYPNYYIDISAVTLPTRHRNFLKIIKDDLLRERLVFGTDYPVPDFMAPFIGKVGYKQYKSLKKEDNFFDRHVKLFSLLGLDIGHMENIGTRIFPNIS